MKSSILKIQMKCFPPIWFELSHVFLALDFPYLGDYLLLYAVSAELKDLQLETFSFNLLELSQANT